MTKDPKKHPLPSIIFIDDADDIRKIVTTILADEFNVIEATNGKEGWKKIRELKDIQLILTDLDMPEMNGFEVINLVRSSDDQLIRELPIIMLTSADEDDTNKEKALKLGATEFHSKPVNTLNLLASVRAHTNYHQTNKLLLSRINVDGLTGLLNKQGFEKQLEKDISMAIRHEQELSVFTVHLNLSNDLIQKLGRESTDKVIKRIANVLIKAVRKEDTVARDGITTFMMSLPTTMPDGAMQLAQRICKAAENSNITFQGETHSLDLSIGICSIETGYMPSRDEAIRTSKSAMSEATRLGKGQICMRVLKKPEIPAESCELSLDHMLSELKKGKPMHELANMDEVLSRLAPIFDQLSDRQKISIVDGSYLKKLPGNKE